MCRNAIHRSAVIMRTLLRRLGRLRYVQNGNSSFAVTMRGAAPQTRQSTVLLRTLDYQYGSADQGTHPGWPELHLSSRNKETFTRKEKGTGRIRCLLAPQVVSCEHRWWVMLISMSLQLAMIVPLAT